MNFPGENTLTFSKAALNKILAAVLADRFGEGIRITEFDHGYSYSDTGCKLTFTTDPEPIKVPQVPQVEPNE